MLSSPAPTGREATSASPIVLAQPGDSASKTHSDDDTNKVRGWVPRDDVIGQNA